MAGRPVHWFTGEDKTGCCGKTVSTLGLGALLCEDTAEVTCKSMRFPEETDLTEAYEALEEAVQESTAVLEEVATSQIAVGPGVTAAPIELPMHPEIASHIVECLVDRIVRLEAEKVELLANNARLHRAYLRAQGIPNEDIPA